MYLILYAHLLPIAQAELGGLIWVQVLLSIKARYSSFMAWNQTGFFNSADTEDGSEGLDVQFTM